MRQIEGFSLAGELLSFVRASEEMHITQSAFSQLIRELESELGVQLFDRTTRRVLLTAAGQAMLLKMKRALDTIDDACAEAQDIGRADRGHIRVGALSSLAVGIVSRTLCHLRTDFPGVTATIREEVNDALIELVTSGGTDLSVCSEVASAPGLSFEYLFADPLMMVTKAGSWLARQRVVHWTDLDKESLVLTARGTSTREHVSAALGAHGIVKPVDYEVASMLVSLSMVRAGFGSAFVSRVALDDLDTAGLGVVPLAEPAVRRMGIYRRSDRKPSLASVKFVELLKAEIQAARRRPKSQAKSRASAATVYLTPPAVAQAAPRLLRA